MCGSMVNIQSPAAQIRRGKKRRQKKPQGKNIMSASAAQGGHNQRKANMYDSSYGYYTLLQLLDEQLW